MPIPPGLGEGHDSLVTRLAPLAALFLSVGCAATGGDDPSANPFADDPALGRTKPCGLWVLDQVDISVPEHDGAPPELSASISRDRVPILDLPPQTGFQRSDALANPVYIDARTPMYAHVFEHHAIPKTVARLAGGVDQIHEDWKVTMEDERASVTMHLRCLQPYWPAAGRPTAG